MRLLIKNCTVIPITGKGVIWEKGEILVEGGIISACGPEGTVAATATYDKVLDKPGFVATPGFINTHTHSAMTLLRSYADDLPLMQWLSEKIWPLEEKLTGDAVYWGSMLSILEMLKSGTTTFADMYFYMDEVAKAVEETGMRAVLSRGMIGVGPNGPFALEDSERFISQWQGQGNGRITTMLGPHAPYTCPPDYLQKVMQLAQKLQVGIHIHLAETKDEINQINELYQKTPIQHVADEGLFSFPTIAAHCVHLTEGDINLLASNKVGVAHNPESNMKLASGIAPIPELLKAGVNVGLGTDGAASNNNLDMLEEMRTAALLHKVNSQDPTILSSYEALYMATMGGAKALGINNKVGSIEVGKRADIVLFDFEKPHLYPKHQVLANLVYAAQAGDVDTVLVDGNIIIQDSKPVNLNEKEIMVNIARVTDELLK
ncbi:MAG: amidohydrolase [Bacillota bacterium]|nr:amidohydrolase [Bacillota bacterium]